MSFYRKKPVIIDAVQFDGHNGDVIKEFAGNKLGMTREEFFIKTLEGNMIISPGDFIIKGIAGEFYPCKEKIFRETYDAVPDRAIDDDFVSEDYHQTMRPRRD